ncbi:unnamed protein product, partial [Amoebophrya sp. A120]|eukprot:GSA120T00020018001.1
MSPASTSTSNVAHEERRWPEEGPERPSGVDVEDEELEPVKEVEVARDDELQDHENDNSNGSCGSCSASSSEEEIDLSERLSIVLVTSPIGMHPQTTLVDGVITSFDLIPGLQKCPLVIVADGVCLIPSDSKRFLERPNKRLQERREQEERLMVKNLRRKSSNVEMEIENSGVLEGDHHGGNRTSKVGSGRNRSRRASSCSESGIAAGVLAVSSTSSASPGGCRSTTPGDLVHDDAESAPSTTAQEHSSTMRPAKTKSCTSTSSSSSQPVHERPRRTIGALSNRQEDDEETTDAQRRAARAQHTSVVRVPQRTSCTRSDTASTSSGGRGSGNNEDDADEDLEEDEEPELHSCNSSGGTTTLGRVLQQEQPPWRNYTASSPAVAAQADAPQTRYSGTADHVDEEHNTTKQEVAAVEDKLKPSAFEQRDQDEAQDSGREDQPDEEDLRSAGEQDENEDEEDQDDQDEDQQARLRLKTNQRQRVVWKRGRVTKEDLDRYTEYVERLRTKYSTNPDRKRETTVLGPLPKHLSFAHALRRGLEEVKTEYVMVVQHDRAFVEQVDLPRALELMEQESKIRYIGFQSRTNANYPNRMLGRYGEWARMPYFCDQLHKPKRGQVVLEELEKSSKVISKSVQLQPLLSKETTGDETGSCTTSPDGAEDLRPPTTGDILGAGITSSKAAACGDESAQVQHNASPRGETNSGAGRSSTSTPTGRETTTTRARHLSYSPVYNQPSRPNSASSSCSAVKMEVHDSPTAAPRSSSASPEPVENVKRNLSVPIHTNSVNLRKNNRSPDPSPTNRKKKSRAQQFRIPKTSSLSRGTGATEAVDATPPRCEDDEAAGEVDQTPAALAD